MIQLKTAVSNDVMGNFVYCWLLSSEIISCPKPTRKYQDTTEYGNCFHIFCLTKNTHISNFGFYLYSDLSMYAEAKLKDDFRINRS